MNALSTVKAVVVAMTGENVTVEGATVAPKGFPFLASKLIARELARPSRQALNWPIADMHRVDVEACRARTVGQITVREC